MSITRRARIRQKARGQAHFSRTFAPMGMFTHIATIGTPKLRGHLAVGEIGRYESVRFI
jgi:hypothetical protein